MNSLYPNWFILFKFSFSIKKVSIFLSPRLNFITFLRSSCCCYYYEYIKLRNETISTFDVIDHYFKLV